MKKMITATFESVDTATLAASHVKDKCDNVKEVKIRYKTPHHSSRSRLFASVFTPVDAATPTVMQNGLFPVAVNIDAIGTQNKNDYIPSKAMVEITATQDNIHTISSILRQGGGIEVKVK